MPGAALPKENMDSRVDQISRASEDHESFMSTRETGRFMRAGYSRSESVEYSDGIPTHRVLS
jgi:hypothetical protein